MRAHLVFDLPEDQPEFRTASQAGDMKSAVWEFDQWLRGKIKYEDKDWQEIRDRLHQSFQDRGVDLYAE